MPAIRKITVTSFDKDGNFVIRANLTLLKTIFTDTFIDARRRVDVVIQKHKPDNGTFIVEWMRDGSHESYLVKR